MTADEMAKRLEAWRTEFEESGEAVRRALEAAGLAVSGEDRLQAKPAPLAAALRRARDEWRQREADEGGAADPGPATVSGGGDRATYRLGTLAYRTIGR